MYWFTRIEKIPAPDRVFTLSAPFCTGKCGGVYETSTHKAEPFTDSVIWNRKNGGFDLYLAVNVTITKMKYLLIDHAKKRIAKRQISSEWIEDHFGISCKN